MFKPTTLAAGVRYDPITKTRQAVVVVYKEDFTYGKIGQNPDGSDIIGRILISDGIPGHTDHLNPHKEHANKLGHGWIDIEPNLYDSFSYDDLESHIQAHIKKVHG